MSKITDPKLKWFDDSVDVILRFLGLGNDKCYWGIEPRMNEFQLTQTEGCWFDDSDDGVAFL